MITSNKKGQLGGLQGIVLTVMIVGLLLGVGFLILNGLKDTYPVDTITVVNETVTVATAGNYLTHNYTTAGDTCYSNPTVLVVYNETTGDAPMIINSANYTLSGRGLFQNISAGSTYSLRWNVTYTYDTGRDGCEGIEDTVTATQKIPELLPVLLIVALVAILLGIVFKIMPGMTGSSGRTAEI